MQQNRNDQGLLFVLEAVKKNLLTNLPADLGHQIFKKSPYQLDGIIAEICISSFYQIDFESSS
jgi:hypothetical protein